MLKKNTLFYLLKKFNYVTINKCLKKLKYVEKALINFKRKKKYFITKFISSNTIKNLI